MTIPNPTIDEHPTLVEKLTCFGGTHPHLNEHARKLVDEAIAELSTLLEQKRKLEDALKPFAKVADAYDDREGDDLAVWIDVHDTVVRKASRLGNFRRARALLSGGGEG